MCSPSFTTTVAPVAFTRRGLIFLFFAITQFYIHQSSAEPSKFSYYRVLTRVLICVFVIGIVNPVEASSLDALLKAEGRTSFNSGIIPVLNKAKAIHIAVPEATGFPRYLDEPEFVCIVRREGSLDQFMLSGADVGSAKPVKAIAVRWKDGKLAIHLFNDSSREIALRYVSDGPAAIGDQTFKSPRVTLLDFALLTRNLDILSGNQSDATDDQFRPEGRDSDDSSGVHILAEKSSLHSYVSESTNANRNASQSCEEQEQVREIIRQKQFMEITFRVILGGIALIAGMLLLYHNDVLGRFFDALYLLLIASWLGAFLFPV